MNPLKKKGEYILKGFGRAALIILFFLAIIINFQFSRMGLFSQSKSFTNDTATVPVFKSSIPSDFINDQAKIRYLILFDKQNDESVRVCTYFQNLLTIYKIQYDLMESDSVLDIKNYTGMIIALNDYSKISDLTPVFSYVEKGGSVVFAFPGKANGTFDSMMSVLGIYESSNGKQADYITDKKGIFGEKDLMYAYEDCVVYTRNLRLRSECDIYFETENQVPLLWKVNFGKGRLYVSNGDIIKCQTGRGVVAQLLYEMQQEVFVYPIFGLVTAHIESFPGPSLQGDYRILEDTKKSYDAFIKDVFWPDMIGLSKEFGIKYTVSFVTSLMSQVIPPFESEGLRNGVLMLYGTETLNAGGEIAFHGFNYRPLAFENELQDQGWFIPWQDMSHMKLSVEKSLQFFYNIFPNYTIRTYFPPEGRMGESVRKDIGYLSENISILCVPYQNLQGDQLIGDYLTLEDGLFHFPSTSGIPGAKWHAVNSLHSLGILSQSMDILYTFVTDQRAWSDVLEDYRCAFETGRLTLPYIKPMTVSSAVKTVKLYEDMDFSIKDTAQRLDVVVENYFEGISFIIRYDKKIKEAKGASLFHIKDDMVAVLPESANFSILWEE